MTPNVAGVALATVFLTLAGDGVAQRAAGPEKDVRVACTHRRMAVRRAASLKAAQAGDAAVPALRKVAAELGLNSLPLELIDALAKTSGPAEGPMVDLLTEWSQTKDFYWRALCLDGLVTRRVAAAEPLFQKAVSDVSHLMRISGARGLLQLGNVDLIRTHVLRLLADEDPRVRSRVAVAIVEYGLESRMARLMVYQSLLGFERRFGDDPWGAREAQRTERALRELTGERFDGLFAEDEETRAEARSRLEAWGGLPVPDSATPGSPDTASTEFLEIRSCRNGDLFLQWSADGQVLVGLDGTPATTVKDAPRLATYGESLEDRAVHGRVVCDFVRARDGSEFDHKAAPKALPKPVADSLKRLAQVLDETGRPELSKALTERLRQFETPDDTR